jgi:glycosyltransferase involved in cell wall biosynthesis
VNRDERPAGRPDAASLRKRASPADGRRPRVALVLDTDGWAFANIARQLQRHLSNRFEFIPIPMDVVDDINQVLMIAQDCDIVHFFWREHLRLIGTPYNRSRAALLCQVYPEFERQYVAPRIFSTAVYDHLLLGEEEVRDRRPLFRGLVRAYYVSSRKLEAIYRALDGYPPPAMVLEDGVDLGLFAPRQLGRLDAVASRELVVGWVGNSKWASEIEDFKGLHTILLPAVEQLRREGVRIRTVLADRAERMIPQTDMPAYYARIDVYVCPSKIEGTPNPVLEAMACGVPVISTDVGIVADAFGPLQKALVLQERSVESVKAALRDLVGRPERLRALSRENVSSAPRAARGGHRLPLPGMSITRWNARPISVTTPPSS